MKRQETLSTQESAQQTDAEIQALYRENTGEVDVQRFATGLGVRLASIRRPAKRRPVIRRVAIAAVALVLMAGVGVGAWQAWQHLGRDRQDVLVIGDPAEGTSVPEWPTAPFTYTGSRSVSELKLGEVWGQAAAALDIDPSRAQLQSLYLCWDSDGLLVQFDLSVMTPDGTLVFFVPPSLGDPVGNRLVLEGWVQHEDGTSGPASYESGLPVLPADQVLASIDSVGLAAIGERTGMTLENTAERESAFNPGVEGVEIAEKRLVWSFSAGDSGRDPQTQPAGVSLEVSGGEMRVIDGDGQLPSVSPTRQFTLEMAWAWKAADSPEPEDDHETTTGGVNEFGPPAADVTVGRFSPGQDSAGEAFEAQAVDARLDGLAFVGGESHIYRVINGSANEIEEATSCSGTGVSYSLGHGWLIYTPIEPYVPVDIDAVSTVEDGEARRLLTHESSNTVVNVRYDERADQLWFGLYQGETYSLWTTKPQTSDPVDNLLMEGATADDPEKTPVSVPLAHDCRGDFAVSADGSTVVYLGLWESPVKAFIRTQEGETQLPLGLATAYSPVFSPDGSKVCFVGSEEAVGETSLWIYDRRTEECTQLETTEGLVPTHPAFSPDGQRIAFRNWELGDLWTVDVDSGNLTRYALPVGEAPIAW
jgi:hypothetical protein